MRILVILNSRAIRNTLSEILEYEGHDVSVADNLETGLRVARRQPFDVIFFDFDLETEEGLKGFRLLQDVSQKSPTFVLISKATVDIDAYKEKGVSSVLYTPLDLNGLMKMLESIEPQESYIYDYPRPAVTADCVVFCYDENRELSVLLIERADEPYKGCWAFPGGFLEENETVEECASRELEEETGLRVSTVKGPLSQLGCFSAVDRDPRDRVITIAFFGVIEKTAVVGQDDAREARWFPVSKLPSLAFDHEQILVLALKRLGFR